MDKSVLFQSKGKIRNWIQLLNFKDILGFGELLPPHFLRHCINSVLNNSFLTNFQNILNVYYLSARSLRLSDTKSSMVKLFAVLKKKSTATWMVLTLCGSQIFNEIFYNKRYGLQGTHTATISILIALLNSR